MNFVDFFEVMVFWNFSPAVPQQGPPVGSPRSKVARCVPTHRLDEAGFGLWLRLALAGFGFRFAFLISGGFGSILRFGLAVA